MQTYFYPLLWILSLCPLLCLAEPHMPERTPEAEALRKTEMMRRDLQLTEQQTDTVYKIHLYYANLRRTEHTRAESMQMLYDMTNALKGILTEEQFQRFMDQVVEPPERRPVMIMNKPELQ